MTFLRGIAIVLTTLTATVWCIWAVAWFDLFTGNPTAINGVIGIGLLAPTLAAASVVVWIAERNERRELREARRLEDYLRG